MRLRFTNSAKTHVLHDPRAVQPRPPGAPPLNLAAETARGGLVAFSFDGPVDHDEDPARVNVFVDEPVDPVLERRAGAKGHGVLRVPGGRLVLTDVDDVGLMSGGAQAIRPGNYDVTWFVVDSGADVERPGAGGPAAPAGQQGLALERLLAPATGVLVFLTMIVLGYAACATVTSDVKFSTAWRAVRWYALAFGGAWVVLLLLWFVAPSRRAAAARAEKLAELPDFVVALRRAD